MKKKLKLLIEKGYFPVQLPPSFNTITFAKVSTKLNGEWVKPPPKNLGTLSEKYSVARSSYYRRVTSIVNPISFYFLAKYIAEHWEEINAHYRKSRISLSRPKLSQTKNKNSIRAININKFSALYDKKIELSSGYRYVLVTDITSFFPSIYTHSIPWALHTKSTAKRDRRNNNLIGNVIDTFSRNVQDGQTMGIPIGPDTSHIISEIIGTAIDIEVSKHLKKWPAGFRYVDDIYFFFNSRIEAEQTLAILIKIFAEYELQINANKTRVLEVKDLIEESWKYSLKKLTISHNNSLHQKNDIHNFFETLFSLEQKFKDESIVKYGLKQISSSIIRKDNWVIFEAYILKCGYSYPNTIQVITSILATYNRYNYKINKKAISRFCNNLILEHAASDHHGEVSWLLWLCKEMKISLSKIIVKQVELMSSNACKLIILDLYNSKIIKHTLSDKTLKNYATTDSLRMPEWLISYEAGRRRWLKNNDTTFIKKDSYFNELLSHNVTFYDENKILKPIFEIKDENRTLDDILDNEDINKYIIFDENDDEYYDQTIKEEIEEDF